MRNVIALSALLMWSGAASASFHSWDIAEVYSNADGSVQYVELVTLSNSQQSVDNRQITADSDGNVVTFTFSGNTGTPTAGRRLLIASPGFASLPGAVTPDYTLPGAFFDPDANSITIDFLSTTMGRVTFSSSDLPTDGVLSLNKDLSTSINSPTNFAGESGQLTGPTPPLFADGFEAEPLHSRLVINEFDYDQVGFDEDEFIELYNAGPGTASLDGLNLILLNGSTGTGFVYQTYMLPGVNLAAGDFYVICTNSATVANCDLDISPDSNLIQNGPADAIALLGGETILDSVSYEGSLAGWAEGDGIAAEDPGNIGGLGFSRAVDGLDTNDNNTDFVLVCITPGQANTDQISDCEVIIETPGVGDLVITELMPNPNAVPDSVGEWFEMINVSASSMSLTGCTIADAALQHIIAGELTVGAGERVLFAKSADSVINGGMSAVDYVYPDIALGNMGDSMSLTCESVEVDIVVYDSSWPYASGVSMQLDPGAQDSVSNNSSSAWCSGASAYGDGDLGTPGEANGDCAPP